MLTSIVVAVIAIGVALLLKGKGYDTGGLSIKKAVRWFAIAATVTLVFWYGPYFTLGYGWGYVTTGHGGWSMASDDGIMPGSLTLHKAYPRYEVGDDISFDYQGSNEPAENGRSIKRILAVNPGNYRVGGTNELNSIMPVDIAPGEIYGKIMWHHSFLPKAYWRWMSRHWSLDDEDIAIRYHRIFSVTTALNGLTPGGRWRNGIAFRHTPEEYRFDSGEMYIVESPVDVKVYSARGEFLRMDRPNPRSPHSVGVMAIDGKEVVVLCPEVGNGGAGYIAFLGDVSEWVRPGSTVVVTRESGILDLATVAKIEVVSEVLAVPYGETRVYFNSQFRLLGPDDGVCVIENRAWKPRE